MNELLSKLGIVHPIIQAPMAGGPSTPEPVAAVSNAGGLGSLAAAYLTPEQITAEVERVRKLTDKPFNVNLFAGGYDSRSHGNPAAILALINSVHERLGIPPAALPTPSADPFPEQFEAVLLARPPVFSFTFGIPDSKALDRIRSRQVTVLGTATTLHEAALLAGANVDGIVAQGSEAGAHRGTFAGPFKDALVPTLDLVRAISASSAVPVIASGGLMDGRDIAAALRAGASAVQLGTAFLACPESGAPATYKKALLEAKTDSTVITSAFSGRPARGIRNHFIDMLDGKDILLPFPDQNSLTRPMRSAAAKRGEPDYLSLWAGQGVARIRALPAAELIKMLIDEMQ